MVIEHEPQLYHLTFGVHEPAMRLQTGQTVRVTVPDCDGLGPDGTMLDRSRFESRRHGSLAIANPTAGPYVVETAQVGDTLVVRIDSIHIDRDFGRTGISARQISIPQKLFITERDADFNVAVPKKEFRWQIDHDNALARLRCPHSRKEVVEVPLRPMVGCVGVAPPNGQFLDGLAVGNFGGNMDVPDVGAGCCIRLPVFVPGGYLFLGDLHAAQGYGEIIGGGVEVSGTIEFTVDVEKGKKILWPRLETDRRIGVIGAGGNVTEAMEIAYAQLVLWLSEDYGFERWEALNLVSQTGRASPGNWRTAVCSIEKIYL